MFVLAGCHSGQNSNSQSGANVNVYHLRGKVVSTDAPHGIVVLDHEAIPGFMDAMTMPYQLKDPSIIGELHPGDVITADVLRHKELGRDRGAGSHCGGCAGEAGLQAPGDLSRTGAGRQSAGLQAAQPGRAGDSPGPVQGQGGAADVYLYALPAAELLPAGDAQFCGHERELAENPALYGKRI